MKVVISPQAADDIEVAMRWWDANRPKAPGLFEKELLRALEFVLQAPRAGAALSSAELDEVRRAPMPKTRYFVFYRIKAEEIRVLRVWHQSRGSRPRL